MPDPELTIGFFTMRTYTFMIAAAILLSSTYVLYCSPSVERTGKVDVLIGGLVGGVVLARIIHVLLNWAHFTYHTDEIIQLSAGGLDWHGAVIGALLTMRWFVRRQGIAFSRLLDSLMPAIPLIAFAGWWGCLASQCSYGAEVAHLTDYPGWMVGEAPDVFNIYAPRFSSQMLGMTASGGLFLVAIALIWREWLAGFRFWLILGLLSIIMFGLGFLRGDYAISIMGLRADQILDIGMLILCVYRLCHYVSQSLHSD